MTTKVTETRQIQTQENPGYLPDRESFAKDLGTRPTREVIAERKKRAAEILARWSSEDGE